MELLQPNFQKKVPTPKSITPSTPKMSMYDRARAIIKEKKQRAKESKPSSPVIIESPPSHSSPSSSPSQSSVPVSPVTLTLTHMNINFAPADVTSREHVPVSVESPPEVKDQTPVMPSINEIESYPPSKERSAHIRHDVFCAPSSPQGDWPPEGVHAGEEISSGHDPPESPLNYDPDEQLSGEFDY